MSDAINIYLNNCQYSFKSKCYSFLQNIKAWLCLFCVKTYFAFNNIKYLVLKNTFPFHSIRSFSTCESVRWDLKDQWRILMATWFLANISPCAHSLGSHYSGSVRLLSPLVSDFSIKSAATGPRPATGHLLPALQIRAAAYQQPAARGDHSDSEGL